MKYTVLHLLTNPAHVNDAVRLVAPDWVGPGVFTASHPGGHAYLVTIEPTARTLGARLAAVTGKPAVAVTVEDERCSLWLAAPDGTQLGPTEGSDPVTATAAVELVGRWLGAAFRSRGDTVAAALADRARPAVERHRQVAKLLDLEYVDPSTFRSRAGVLLIDAPADEVRARLPVDGHGAWVVPLDSARSLVVPDGSGPMPVPASFAGVVRGSRAVMVEWGDAPMLRAFGGNGERRTNLAHAYTLDAARLEARQLAAVLGRPEIEAALTDVLRSPAQGDRAALALRALSVEGVPVGANVDQLAAWAATRPGAVRVPAAAGTTLVLRPVLDDALRQTYRRRRAIRRLRWATFALMALSGLGAVVAWDRAWDDRWLVATGVFLVAFVVLLAVWLLLGRLLRGGSVEPRTP
ncbi:hypothetical protein [Thermasporomyces composti]|jgi:hypothetical protein|uniref:Uncharacterized protein n=1 Tax=Thermasporomyces composti TaxID=696763 RepID=A0A3D9V6M6_THECX|nr:hypothetical protein [Thermasporomyces composti]REF36353.1 hypothetical protein DFJ64_1760 [Thermasporomyces composti]